MHLLCRNVICLINLLANYIKRVVLGGNSSSEPNLTTAGNDRKSGFPPGITVDELWLYRRKKPSGNAWPSDNLHLEEGTFRPIKSEYKRRFKNYYKFGSTDDIKQDISPTRASKPEDELKIEGPQEFNPLYKENFIEYSLDKLAAPKPKNSFEIIDYNEREMKENSRENNRLLTEIRSSYVKYPSPEKVPFFRRPTTLKLEGDFYTITEQTEQFIPYLPFDRPSLLRKATTLKLEGDMDINTENREQFIAFELPPKPPLYKKLTNLHLEGDLNILTEKQEKFIRYDVQKRPPFRKKETNLKIEGDLDFLPEYRKEFIEYKIERSKPALPVNNLKTDGFYDVVSDVSTAFDQQVHPQIPNLRKTMSQEDLSPRTRLARLREDHLKTDGPMETQTENRMQFIEMPVSKVETPKVTNNLLLEGRIDLNPEYRNAYIDYSKDGSMDRMRSRRAKHENHLKSEGNMEITPEYRCSYVDFPRKRPQIRKPESHLVSEGEQDHMSEKSEKYVPFSNHQRTEPLKPQAELKLEGKFECQPEYRKAYIDYLIRERAERKPRPLDNLESQQKKVFDEEPVIKISTNVLVPNVPSRTTSPNIGKTPKSAKSRANKSAKNRSLTQIESSVFGPRLTVPESKRRVSRSNSPSYGDHKVIRPKSRSQPRNSSMYSSDSDEHSRAKHKLFGNTVLVQNIASRSTTPLLPTVDISARNKWMRDSSVESSSAFVVLDNNVNNENTRRLPSKWTPSWNSNSSDY